jgi:lipoyl(octanoyl) transferase
VSAPAAAVIGDGVVEATPLVKWLGSVGYESTWRAMQRFTDERHAATRDEIWLLEHEPVFTLGMNANRSHLLDPGDIPVIQIDRGGEVTYHGPGQLVVYPLIDVRRAGLGVRDLVTALEKCVVTFLATRGIAAHCRPKAPGVYVRERKIASVGLRIRRGGSYHGLAFNISMDLAPFQRINPCGYTGLEMTRLRDFSDDADVAGIAPELAAGLVDAIAQVRRIRRGSEGRDARN